MRNSLQSHGLQPTRLLCPWDFSGKDTGVVCHFLLQGIFPTKGLNPGLLHCRQILYQLSSQGSPLRPWDMTIFPTVQQVPYIGTFRLQTFKDVNMHSHVQSHKLVPVSSVHCHMRKPSTSGCAFVYFTVHYRVEYSIFISSPGCLES